jgi:hypothetical protein
MNAHPQDMQAVLTRIDTLERQNRWLIRAGLVVSLVAVALVTMGQARTSRTVEAERFLLKDVRGSLRGELKLKDDGAPALILYDPNGKSTAEMGTDEKIGPYLVLSEAENKAHFIVYVEPIWGPKLGFQDASGKSQVDFFTRGPTLKLVDENGYSAVLGVDDLFLKHKGEKRTTSAASLLLFDKEGKVIWSAP